MGLITSSFSFSGRAIGSTVQLAASGYGFRFVRHPVTPPTIEPLLIRIRDAVSKQTRDIAITDSSWHEEGFGGIEAVVTANMTGDSGIWLLTTALQPNSRIRPVHQPQPADFPAVIGGTPNPVVSNVVGEAPRRVVNMDIDAANTPADFPTNGGVGGDGVPINSTSAFDVFVSELGGTNLLLGGGVDIWKFNTFSNQWAPVLNNVPLALAPGGGAASIPAADLGVRQAGDRIIALPNGVTFNDGGATARVWMRTQ